MVEQDKTRLDDLTPEQIKVFLENPVWLAIVENLENAMVKLAQSTMESPTLTTEENNRNKMFYKAVNVLIQRPVDMENFLLLQDVDLTQLLNEETRQ